MDLTTNIILWTTSLILATSGILFGFIASYNARKANINIKKLIAKSLVYNGSQKFFFKNLQDVLINNKEIIQILRNKNIKYLNYSLKASKTRLAIIPLNLVKEFENTKYKDICQTYIFYKKTLDNNFKDIFEDLSILKTNESITNLVKNQLLKYHYKNIKFVTNIIKNYGIVSSKSSEEFVN